MYKLNRTDKIDIDLYDQRINRTGYILYDRDSVEKNNKYYKFHAETCLDLARMRMVYKSGNQCCYLDRNSILRYLMEFENCPESFFKTSRRNSNSGGYSLDSKKVLGPLKSKGFAEEFITNYIEHKSWKTKCGKLNSILNSCREFVAESTTGKKLYKLPFYASVQKNRRFNYHDFDIIAQIPKSMANCISVEDGYFLAWGDFAQSDFRIAYNLFLRSPENDKLFNAYEDKYEALARMICNMNHEKFDYDKFKSERQVYKRNTLATMYGQRSALLEEDANFIRTFATFIEKMPGYSNYLKRLNQYITMRLPILVSSYFGFKQQIYDAPTISRDSVRNDALNTPVQTGTSEIVIATVNSILDKCYAAGYTEDDISLYMTRHDEPIFKIKSSAKGVFSILHDHTTIIVDDWTPLRLDWNFGYSYKESDEALETEFAELMANTQETKVSTEAICSTVYEPLDPIFAIGIAKHQTPDAKTIVTFYDEENNEVMYSLFDTVDDELVDLECKKKIRAAESQISAGGKHNIVIFSTFLNGVDYWGSSNISYNLIKQNSIAFSAKRLGEIMLWRYCHNAHLEPNIESPVFTSYDNWINEVKDSRYLIVKE